MLAALFVHRWELTRGREACEKKGERRPFPVSHLEKGPPNRCTGSSTGLGISSTLVRRPRRMCSFLLFTNYSSVASPCDWTFAKLDPGRWSALFVLVVEVVGQSLDILTLEVDNVFVSVWASLNNIPIQRMWLSSIHFRLLLFLMTRFPDPKAASFRRFRGFYHIFFDLKLRK